MTAPDDNVLQLLRCPATHSKLSTIEATELAKLNEQIRLGKSFDRKGQPITKELESGLVNAERSHAYSIREGIMQLIADEGIVL